MKRALLLVALLATAPATAALAPADLAGIGAAPPVGARLPDLPFIDQNGAPYRLAPGSVPTALLFADYSCRHICGPGITLTAGALHDAGLVPGRDYRMIVIGLDQDGPAIARRLVAERLHGLDAEQSAITLLTGSPADVASAERALGYHAIYDREADQFAHDAALYIFDRTGRLASLLPEIGTTPDRLAAALKGPVAAPPSSLGFADHVAALCYGLGSAHGVYAGPIVFGLRAGGVLICLGLAGFLVWSFRRRRRGEAA